MLKKLKKKLMKDLCLKQINKSKKLKQNMEDQH